MQTKSEQTKTRSSNDDFRISDQGHGFCTYLSSHMSNFATLLFKDTLSHDLCGGS